MNNKKFPLIVEAYPVEYIGYEFITLIRYNDNNTLNIVDNIINNNIVTYVLDLCTAENVNESKIIDVANNWYNNKRELYPISIEFSKANLAYEASKIVRIYPMDYVSRVIGPLHQYKMAGTYRVRKRKKKEISKHIQIVNKIIASQKEFEEKNH